MPSDDLTLQRRAREVRVVHFLYGLVLPDSIPIDVEAYCGREKASVASFSIGTTTGANSCAAASQVTNKGPEETDRAGEGTGHRLLLTQWRHKT